MAMPIIFVIQFQFTYHISQEEEAFTEQTLTTIVASMHGLSELKNTGCT
ncbi:hypothetical protein LSPH26S_02230 [Lysinibacillus sphaericus]